MSDNIFNNADKRKQTKQEVSDYFKTDDRPLTTRLSSAFSGMFSSDTEERKRKLAEGLAKKAQAGE